MSDENKERPLMFPSHLFDEVRKSRFWVLENEDICDQQELDHLLTIMFNCPEDSFYLYVPENESICPVIRKAMDSNVIIGSTWKRNFYPHPRSDRDYVHILPDNAKWDWERELLDSAQEYLRFELALSEAAKRKMQIEQHISAQQEADSNPIELKPNFMGFGIDLSKGWSWLRKKLKF